MASMFSTREAFNIAFKFLSASVSLAGILMILRSVVGEVILGELRSYFSSFFHYLISEMASMFSTFKMSNIASTSLSTFATFAGTLMLLRFMAGEFIPEEFSCYFFSFFHYLFTSPSSNLTLVINESSGLSRNEVYDAAELYLPTKIGPKTKPLRPSKTERIGLSKTERIGLSKTERQRNFTITMEKDEEIVDFFEGIVLTWRYNCIELREHYSAEKKFFELSFNKKFRDKVVGFYLPHVLDRAKQIKKEFEVVKIYNQHCSRGDDDTGFWDSMDLEHPATFETLAVDPEVKKMIINDLERFVGRREFYKKVGKAWKRGYLLYGPPGTGKSSLIAAMANYLKFDIYQLELASIHSDPELRNVLLSTTNKSILVIEDIDRSIQVQDRKNQLESDNSNKRLTLSGMLNSIDGLCSSCVDEKIIVFTTSHKDRLDPALLRPGRIDMQIHMSYCTPYGFRFLAANYIGIKDHELFGEIEEAITTTEVTPAEVAEQLMRNDGDLDAPLNGLIQFLKEKKRENEEAEAKKNSAHTTAFLPFSYGQKS